MDSMNEDILLRYLKNECTGDDWLQINSWLNESEDNARKLFQMEEAFHSGERERYSSSEYIEKARTRFLKKIEKKEQPGKRFFQTRSFMRYAATIIIVLTFGTMGVTYLANQLSASNEMIVSVSDNEPVKEVVLPDGSKIWLNHSATLKYPKAFAKNNRMVKLDGEAYFEVAKDKTKPFIVSSDVMQVKVLGTIFNLKCNKYAKVAEATLIEGMVEVKGNRDEGQIVLSPGQKAELNRATGHLVVKQVDAKLDAVWKDNLIPFEEATVSEIANTLEHFYNVKIVLSPNIDNKTYTGVLKRKGSVDSVLNSLKNAMPIDYRRIENDIIYIQPAHKK